MNTMNDEGERICPLCMEEMDMTDQQLKPCKCGYEICVWCWHQVMEMAEKDNTEGRCPACRTPYDKERIFGMTVSCERLAEINSEKKQKLQRAKSRASDGRKHLSNVRVIQKNLAFIIGIPANMADEELLQRREYFGQYGKILKVSVSRNGGGTQHSSSNNSCNLYITFSKDEEAIRCIQAVNGYVLDGRTLRACFGTTKYCHAWLRNMPCTNPDCLYLHDAGTQDDSFTKDEAASPCARIQQSPGSLNNSQRRSGSCLPPPVDDICSNNNISLSKPLVRPESHIPGGCSKSTIPNADAGKCGVLPAGASWGMRVAPERSSVTSSTVTQGPANTRSGAPNCSFVSSSTPETKKLDQIRHSNQGEEPRIGLKKQKQVHDNLGTSSSSISFGTEGSQQNSPDLCVKDRFDTSAKDMESKDTPLADDSNGVHCSPKSCDHPSNLPHSSDFREMETTATSSSLFCEDLTGLHIEGGHIMDHKFDEVSLRFPYGAPISSKIENDSLTRQVSGFGEIEEASCMLYGSPKPLESLDGEVDIDIGENRIISDILSLDLGFDDHSVNPDNLAEKLLRKCDKRTDYAKLFSPWKSCAKESRFSFAREDTSIDQASDLPSVLNYSRCGWQENFDKQDFQQNNEVHANNPPNGVAACDFRISNTSNSQALLSPTDVAASIPVSKPEVSPSPRFLVPNKAPAVPPPGFYSQRAVDQEKPFVLLPSAGSTSHYQFIGHSVSSNSPQQIPGNNNNNNVSADVEFIDPAIMAISRGKLPLSMTQLISPNYSTNFLGVSEIDQRLHLLKSRSSNLNQNWTMSSDQGKQNLFQEIALQEAMRSPNGSWAAWSMANQTAMEPGLMGRRVQSSLAEITNSERVGFLDSQFGFRRPFPGHEETKFQAPNSSFFYNSAFGM